MTIHDLKKEIRMFEPAIRLDRFCSRYARYIIRKLLIILLGLSLIGLYGISPFFWPVIFLLAAAILFFFAIECFYRSYANRDLPPYPVYRDAQTISFDVAEVMYAGLNNDLVRGFLRSIYGRQIILRLGIPTSAVEKFIRERRELLKEDKLVFAQNDVKGELDLDEYVAALIKADKSFSDFFLAQSVSPDDVIKTATWIHWRDKNWRRANRWWSKERLARVKGIGKDWAYGTTYELEKYSFEVEPAEITFDIEEDYYIGKDEVRELESVLSKRRESNAIIVADDDISAHSVVRLLAGFIREGVVFPELEHKRILEVNFDTVATAAFKTGDFERLMIAVMNEAVKAGNIIIVIRGLKHAFDIATSKESNLLSILDPYLSSQRIQIVATTDIASYHNFVEREPQVGRRFDKILVKSTTSSTILRAVETEAEKYEYKYKIFFLYESVKALANGAVRYFSSDDPMDKALDLLSEVLTVARTKRMSVIEKHHVQEIIERRTGVPVTDVGVDEKNILSNLEEHLHKDVVGQEEAIKAIAGALRRARSGIGNPNKPIGTLLFLGPTGVGKTETAKTLARTFFGNEESMMRLDMSEYKTEDALEKLIGDFSSGKSGVLSNMIKEKPYGVLLLDEFEKTIDKVHNLFLQILDEGFFSDMSGSRINARNLIIIATSNAGSDLVWESIKKGEDLSTRKNFVIEKIIERGIFRPELLNRFDGIILFHTLNKIHLEKIAELMLKKLGKRLVDKGIKLIQTDDLIKFLVDRGHDEVFGARAMSRAVLEVVEQAIADRIIRGEIKAGDEVKLSSDDLKSTVAV